MQTCASWLKENRFELPGITDEELEELGGPPEGSVYTRIVKVTRLVLHHSATETGCARVFRCLHRACNGWADIGYHYVIGNGTLSGDGELEKGRPEWAVGAHARRNNDDSIGICLVGNMERHPPTEKQLLALGELMHRLMSDHGIGRGGIYLHGELKECSTHCPGRYFDHDTVDAALAER
ncbi:MAG: hypothetical protein AVO35_00425 [Candidatus Aegiribacteria sp. MLS_C]|nr:MAG: hypothetical protein AVO35_00425 [Candidatus Aegiribacteria sp. MLS_C]